MGVVLVSIVVAVVAARLAGGRFNHWWRIPWNGAEFLIAGLAAPVIAVLLGWTALPAGPTLAAGLGVGSVLLAAFAAINRTVAGVGLIAAGLFLNGIVVALNGAMPVSVYAAYRSGAGPSAYSDERHIAANSSTQPLLGEIIPVPLPGHPEVDSIGTLLAAAGLAQLFFGAVRPYRQELSQPQRRRQVSRPATERARRPGLRSEQASPGS